jgi:opacity protein-like surface antigen
VPIRSSQIEIQHQLALMPYIGRSFGNVSLYAGGGPALFGTKSKIIDAVGYAVIGGNTVSVTGAPVSFSSGAWVWGGAAQIGTDYYFSPGWFLDLNYTYARSAEYKIKYSASFSNANGPLTSQGTANLYAQQQLTTQAIVLTLNRMF